MRENGPESTPSRPVRDVVPVLSFRLVASAAQILAVILTARQLGPDGRGTLVLLTTLCMFTMLFCSFGVNIAGRVHLVSSTKPLELRDYLGLTLLLTGLEAVVAIAVGYFVLPLTNVPVNPSLLFLVGLTGAGLLSALLLRDALYAYGFNSRAAGLAAGAATAQLGLVLALAGWDADSATAYFAALAAGTVLEAVVAYGVLRRTVRVRTVGFSIDAFKMSLRRGAPALGLSLGQAATFRLDRYIIGLLLGPGAVGVYSIAATATEILWQGPISLAQVQFHRIASGRAGSQELHRARRLWLGGTAVLALLMGATAPVMVHLVVGEEFKGAVTPLRILLLGAMAISSYYLDSVTLTARGHTTTVGGIALLGLFLVTVGDLFLIPLAGIAGAAWASVAGYSAMAVVARILAGRSRPLT